MLTTDTFMQITNLPLDISFANNIAVDLVDECQNVIQSLIINVNFFYREFLHPITGVKQISFEWGNLGIDYGEQMLFLRVRHTVSNAVWYSYGFTITDKDKEETTLFEYKNEGYFQGISYDIQNYFQSIRLKCFETDPDSDIQGEGYTQLPGRTISLRPIITPIEKYIMYMCNKFIYKRLVVLLNHDIIYINNYRVSNKPKPVKGQRVEDTNFFEVTFDANPTEEYRATQYQLYEPLIAVSTVPTHMTTFTLADFNLLLASTNIKIQFNKLFSLVLPGFRYKMYQDGILVVDSPFATVTSYILGLDDLQTFTYANGIYHVVIEPDVVKATQVPNQNWAGFAYGDWKWIISNAPPVLGDYSNTDYNNSDYATTP